MNLSIDFKILNPLIKDHLPHYASKGSAGLDLRACIEHVQTINPGETFLIPTGISRSGKQLPVFISESGPFVIFSPT